MQSLKEMDRRTILTAAQDAFRVLVVGSHDCVFLVSERRAVYHQLQGFHSTPVVAHEVRDGGQVCPPLLRAASPPRSLHVAAEGQVGDEETVDPREKLRAEQLLLPADPHRSVRGSKIHYRELHRRYFTVLF